MQDCILTLFAFFYFSSLCIFGDPNNIRILSFLVKPNNIRIRSFLGSRIIFVFVFGHQNTIRSALTQYVYQPTFEVRQRPCVIYSTYTNRLTKLLTGAGAREADASKNIDICVNNQLCNVLLLVTLIFIA